MLKGQLSREMRLQTIVTRLKHSNERQQSIIKELRSVIASQEKTINELKEKLEDKEAQRQQLLSYLYKPNRNHSSSEKSPGKQTGAPAYHRKMPDDDEVTSTRTFSVKKCPSCRHTVGDAVDTVIKYEEDIVFAPQKKITKYIITRHWCSHCEEYVRSSDAPPISRIGLNVLGYILYARYRLRLPINKIQESLSDLHDFTLSQGEIIAQLKRGEKLFGEDYHAITLLIKQAKVVYADETGWRMEGKNWWLWVFTTNKETRFVIEDTRGKGVPKEVLGEKKDRVIISDGYAAYQNLPGDKQQCWIHLLRVAKLASPQLYHDLVLFYQSLGDELTKPVSLRDPPAFQKNLTRIMIKSYSEGQTMKVQTRIKKHFHSLLTCLTYDDVLPENNTAERAIRPQVVMRKIFGGSRSVKGARIHEVNTSVLETLRQRNPRASFFDVVLPLLEKRLKESHSEL